MPPSRRVIRTQGMELNTLGGAVANPQGPLDVIIKLVSVASGIPIRILTGSERGELASLVLLDGFDGDTRNLRHRQD